MVCFIVRGSFNGLEWFLVVIWPCVVFCWNFVAIVGVLCCIGFVELFWLSVINLVAINFYNMHLGALPCFLRRAQAFYCEQRDF